MIPQTLQEKYFFIDYEDFADLQINPTQISNFYYLRDIKNNSIIKYFVLRDGKQSNKVCEVKLIKQGDYFSPRLVFSIRNKSGKVLTKSSNDEEDKALKARVGLDDCHENFWKLISFITSLKEIDIPDEKFSLTKMSESELISDLTKYPAKDFKNIMHRVINQNSITLTELDINLLLNRKGKLSEFGSSLNKELSESFWQHFFESNKWIFGYGLNYQILNQENSQPHYGGTTVSGVGEQKGDFLTTTKGEIKFTVLVEIKTPDTPLLQGKEAIRNGAWSISKDLTDAISQLISNVDMWDKRGSKYPETLEKYNSEKIYTVKPKGILVIGSLSSVAEINRRESFERFRKSILGIDIITFDELHERAKFIVEHSE